MDRKEIVRKSLQPFNNIETIRKYFSAVKTMDRAAVANKKFDTGRIMALWHEDGKLTIGGKPLGGDHSYSGADEISGFYERRAKGVDGEIAVNVSSIEVANAKSADHVVASGLRYVVTHKEEGLQVPFTHNFTLRDGRIAELRIHVGTPAESKIAPLGALQIEDLGHLSAMAWMVA
ncbi:nuclear transport factor 2 family protein [Indioceanicola profundi]|uniref:nuclear transport factor 2 family protein n=1 Tax=Indioceanicola profundi TaxID=2220096 RepID=UPI0013C527E9|nr:nuclear transport factor 2 family protein [Indioceanicola profundi]